jgi:hypothetical protein
MQYILLIYGSEETGINPESPEFGPYMQGYVDFTEKVQSEGKMIAGEALDSVATAKTLSNRNSKINIVDGPFAETKEQLGGYYLLECSNLDEAIAYAAMIPDAKTGRVEIRPIVVWE